MRFSKGIKIAVSALAILLIVMAVTNPTLPKFITYTNSIGFNDDFKVRTGNYLFFSTYQCGDYSFLGIFNKFTTTRSPLD